MSGIENSLISALVNNPETIVDITVKASDFSDVSAAQVYTAVTELIADQVVPELITISERLNEKTGDEWLARVHEILSAPAVPQNIEAYQDAIRKQRRKKRLLLAGQDFMQRIDSGDPDPASQLLVDLRSIDAGDSAQVHGVSDFYSQILERADAVANGEIETGVPTGIEKFDDYTCGLLPGDSIVLAARTSIGKTAFMCNLAVNARQPVGIISAEQPAIQITERVLARLANVSAFRLRSGKLHNDEFPRLIAAHDKIANVPIHIVDLPRPSMDRVEQIARSLVHYQGIKALYIDYLQLIKNNAYSEKRLQVADISARCKELARVLDIPVVVLAQLSRGAEGREPQLSDLKESGAIEEDADVVVLLYPHETNKGQLCVSIKKNRNGPKVRFEVNWNPEYMRVENI